MAHHGGDSGRTLDNFIKLKIRLRTYVIFCHARISLRRVTNAENRIWISVAGHVIYFRKKFAQRYKSNYNYYYSNKLYSDNMNVFIDLCVHVTR